MADDNRYQSRAAGYEWTPTPRRPWVVRAVDDRTISRHETAEQARAAYEKATNGSAR